ncbi:hypothetical protein LINPERPRIM_LOCUS14571, partial [Linum perenne]
RHFGGEHPFKLSDTEWLQTHRHVLIGATAVGPFLQEFQEITRQRLRGRPLAEVEKAVHRDFVQWFRTRILNDDQVVHSKNLRLLARGPLRNAFRFNGYDVNGYQFRTSARDKGLNTQNNGVYGSYETHSYASSVDNRPHTSELAYYGKLEDIVELNYYGEFRVVLFKCKWANTHNPRYVKTDKLGFTLLNFSHLLYTGRRLDDEPYIEAKDARMVYYVEDKVEKGWCVPIHIKPREVYDMGEHEGSSVHESDMLMNPEFSDFDNATVVPLTRPGTAEFED